MQILKFGGTSVQDAPALRRLQALVGASAPQVIVVSALAGVTDELLALTDSALHGSPDVSIRLEALKDRHFQIARELGAEDAVTSEYLESGFRKLRASLEAVTALGEASPRTRDFIVAHGELFSSRLIASFLRAPFLAPNEILRTDDQFGSAAIDWQHTREACETRVRPLLKSHPLAIIGGFVGSSPEGFITTLGRGGSDYTASVLAACLGAELLEFWKDVDGLLTADPRLIPGARLVPEVTYGEAAELCYFGAKILHPETIRPAVENGIPIRIRNSRRGRDAPGTRIVAQSPSPGTLRSLTLKRDVTTLHITSTRMLGAAGFLKSLFDVFARFDVSVDLISTSEVSVSLTLERAPAPERLEALRAALAHFATIEVPPTRAVVSCVGEGLGRTPGLAARIFGALGDINIHMISQGASELNLGLVVDGAAGPEALRRLHSSFFG